MHALDNLIFMEADNCLDGLTFVIMGILESIEREEAADLIQRYGGKVTHSVSKKKRYHHGMGSWGE